MEIILTPDQEAFVREAVKTGRAERPEDVVTEALSCGRNVNCCARNLPQASTRQRPALHAAKAGTSHGTPCRRWPRKPNSGCVPA